MTSADKLLDNNIARIMLVGYPGSGKTGCLASLVDAGFKLRILDFDGNCEPLILFSDKSKLPNVDIVSLEDKLRQGPKWIEPDGLPTAFSDGLKLMNHWKYKEGEEEIDLGKSKDWGPDTILVLDSLTAMGKASMRRTIVMNNRTIGNVRRQEWGTAMSQQDDFIARITSKRNNFHVIVLAHLKIISPKDIEKNDEGLTKDLKEKIADIIPTRLFPSALGQNLPPEIGGHFPTLLLAEPNYKGSSVKRMIKTVPRPELDLKAPAPNLPKELPLETAMVTIFKELGCKMPEGENPHG